MVANPIANRILSGDVKPGDEIRINADENFLDFTLKHL